MNTAGGLDDERIDNPDAMPDAGPHDRNGGETGREDIRSGHDAGVGEVMFPLGGDERRMHVRAYNHWVSLLMGRPYPSIANLEPETITDFGPHSVLLDFSHGMGDPRIAYLGRALREECGLEGPIATIADVPSRSLLSRLTDHYLQIIANRAPIGFEAEFISSRGRTTLYRGILMPFSSSGDAIDYIYGVINWKELADDAMQAILSAELDAAVRAAPLSASSSATQVWADGPSGGFDLDPAPAPSPSADPAAAATEPMPPVSDLAIAGPLGAQLAAARDSAAQARAAEARSRAAVARALGRAHDLALAADRAPEDFATMLAGASLTDRGDTFLDIVRLVFGTDVPEPRLTHFAAVLAHAQRHRVPMGGVSSFIEGFDGDLAAIAEAEASAAAHRS